MRVAGRSIAVLALVVLLGATSAWGVGRRLRAATGDGHVWLLIDGDPITLMHQGRATDADVIGHVNRPLSRWPEALGAWSDRLWLVLDPGETERREVYSLEARFNTTIGRYVFAPIDRLTIAPPIESDESLEGFVGAPGGPVALMVGSGSDAAARLLQLADGQWTEVDSPAGLPAGGLLRLAPPDRTGLGLTILAAAPGDRQRATLHRRDAQGSWRSFAIDLDLQAVIDAGRVDKSLLLVRRVAPDQRTALSLDYVRPGGLVPLTLMPNPEGAWAVATGWGTIRLLELPRPVATPVVAPESLTLRRIDSVTGVIGGRQQLRPPPGTGTLVLQQSLLLALVVTVTMLVLVARPGQRTIVSLPPDLTTPTALRRLTALSIDLAPGAALAMLLLRAGPADLLRMPLLAMRLPDTAAYLLMIAVTWVHTSVTETVTSRTLGKLIVGARVVRVSGGRAAPLVLLWRNVVKLVVLLIPPLGLLTLLSPQLQGAQDLFARTVVVVRRTPDERDR